MRSQGCQGRASVSFKSRDYRRCVQKYRVRSAATRSKDAASRPVATLSAARASRSFSAGVSGGSRMAGTIARVGGRYGRPSFVLPSRRLHLALRVGASGRRDPGEFGVRSRPPLPARPLWTRNLSVFSSSARSGTGACHMTVSEGFGVVQAAAKRATPATRSSRRTSC